MTPIRLIARWFVPRPEAGWTTSALSALMVASRDEPGCLDATLTTQAGERVRMRYEETWESEEALKNQIRSERFTRLAAILEAAPEQPEIQFILPGGVFGVEYAEAVRQGANGATN